MKYTDLISLKECLVISIIQLLSDKTHIQGKGISITKHIPSLNINTVLVHIEMAK